MKRLLLFDIDGTLLSSGRTAREVFRTALEEVFGTCGDVDGYAFEGKLDPIIVSELMLSAGVEEQLIDSLRSRALDLYLDRLEAALRAEKPVLKPGVEPLLAEVSATPDVSPAVLTGNVERGARLKLGAAGIWDHFLFGVFGDEAPRREGLGHVALQRALETTGHAFRGEDCVVIGDSRHDVACGLAIGARVVAVATGRTSAEDLREAGATIVLKDFSDLAASREAILG